MVAITVLLAGVVYILVSGTLGPPAPEPATISFQSQGWDQGNYTAAVISSTGVADIPADGLTFILRDQDRVAYFSGPANTPQDTSGITTTVFFIDHDSDNRVSGGDSVRIQVEPQSASAAFDGGFFEVIFEGRQLALHPL